MGRTYAVAVRDRGEPLDMRAEEPDEHLGLGLAQLREICGHMCNRAVVLAHLDARAGLLGRRGVAIGREGPGQHRSQFGWTAISWHLCQCRRVANFETVQALPRERAHRRVAAGISQVSEGLDRDVVVGMRKQGVAVVGQGKELRRAATASQLSANLTLRDLAHPPGRDQRIEVAADRRGRETEAGAEGTGALRTAIVQGPDDPVTGSRVIGASSSARRRGGRRRRVRDRRGFHNTIVTYLPLACTHPPAELRWAGYLGSARAAYHRAR